MRSHTDRFVDELRAIGEHGVADGVQRAVRLRLLDYVGVALAGASLMRERVGRYLAIDGDEPPRATVIGHGVRRSTETAALLNGMQAHAAELDDGDRFGMVHPGAPVISAVLAVAEANALSAEAMNRGLAVGYEAAVRLARAGQPALKDRGYHATGICGAIGAAMGVASALGMSRQETHAALAAAATGAAGILKVIRDESELKPLNAGMAAARGVSSANVARAGFMGPRSVLDGADGFLAMYGGPEAAETGVAPVAGTLAVQSVYVKPYAACRHCHAPIEAVLRLRADRAIEGRDITSVRVTTHRWARHLHDHTEIEGSSSAKMSIPYSVAVALMTGRAQLEEFEAPHLTDAATLRLTRSVTVDESAELTALVPRQRAAIVEIGTADGGSYRARVDLPKGEPETPLTAGELMDRFLALASYAGKAGAVAEALARTVLDPASSASDVMLML